MSKFAIFGALGAAILLTGATAGSAAAAVELPARKSGYWEIEMVHGKAGLVPPTVVHTCVDAASDKAMMAAGMSAMKAMCKQTEIQNQGGTYVWDSACDMGIMKTTSHAVMSGDFQSTYTITITGEVSGLSKTPTPSLTTQNAKWLGETCQDGLVPGDIQMDGGPKMNINTIMKSVGDGGAAPAQ